MDRAHSIMKCGVVIFVVFFVCGGCCDDPVDVRDGGPLDGLEIAVLGGSVVADRLTPNFENPGSYIIQAGFSLRVKNTNSADTVYQLAIPSADLIVSSIDTFLGTVEFDSSPLPALPPGAVDTIDVDEICGHLNVGEDHCNQPLRCRIMLTDITADIRYTETRLSLICIP